MRKDDWVGVKDGSIDGVATVSWALSVTEK